MLPRPLSLLAVLLPGIVCAAPAENMMTAAVTATTALPAFTFADQTAAQQRQAITTLIDQAYAEYVPIFGGLPRDEQGKPYQQLQVQVKSGALPGGEADPGVISITVSDKTLFGYASWQTLVLHEIFHLWSAESFRYASQQEQWFNEGVTDFYAYRTACRIGLITPQQALTIAALPLGYYSSADQPFSLRKAAEVSKTANYFLVYNGGWVTAMVLDMDIRQRTANQHSLDDLMRWLYQHKPRHKALYTQQDLLAGLKATTGLDYSGFFSRYIEGTEKIPVATYFNLGRAAWELAFGEMPSAQSQLLYQTLGFPSAANMAASSR